MRLSIMVGVLFLALVIVGGCAQQQTSEQNTYIDVTPAEAKALIDENPDLIILDVIMPKMEGYNLCRLLKFDEQFKHIPIIMFTVKSEDVDKTMGKNVGDDDYITKPFSIKGVLGKVKKHLEK